MSDANERSKRQAFRDKNYPNTVWKNNRVAYFFDRSASERVRRVFKKGAQVWRDNTCIDIYEDTCAISPDRIRVFMEEGCWSYLGRKGGEQNLSLGEGCDTEDWLDEFRLESRSTNHNYDLPYDVGSIMHYGATVGSANKNPTMIPYDKLHTRTLGSPFVSFYDILMLNKHYNCTDKCDPKTSAKCAMGGIPHPRDCSKCICPGGYAGRFCKERPSGCGQELIASHSAKTFTDSIGDKSSRTVREDFIKCHYLIKAPPGKKVEVKLLHFSTSRIAADGCKYGGVEIKTQVDQRLTGYRFVQFCSLDNVNTTLVSPLNVVPIITFNRLYQTDTVIQYRYL
ncbi:unnamed protein product [Heligmosomoides polygyrus]|uniref:Zinc metalloproteinase n=1 Tax=Heligmosomoides polygyrus TaxID=6339 RepID=A0A183FRX3_HELPZ|nr:unnamed protein product [Heligmosomoides polygyrus]